MAEFTKTYNDDGSYVERLTFDRETYTYRRRPYVKGIAKSVDKTIAEQMEENLAHDIQPDDAQELLVKDDDMCDGFADGQDVIPWLTKLEKKLKKKRGE